MCLLPAGHATTQPYPAKRFAAELSRKAIEERRVTVMEEKGFEKVTLQSRCQQEASNTGYMLHLLPKIAP